MTVAAVNAGPKRGWKSVSTWVGAIIVGIAVFCALAAPWIVPYERQGQKLEDFPHVKRWFEAMQSRPAVIRAYEWADKIRNEGMTEEARKNLFGQTAASVKPA